MSIEDRTREERIHRKSKLFKAANNMYNVDKGTSDKIPAIWIDNLTDEDRKVPPLSADVWRQPSQVTSTPPMVITNDCSGEIINDKFRDSVFEKFDIRTNYNVRILPTDTDYTTREDGRTFHFRKNPVNGEWYLWMDGIAYTRTRTLNVPHFDDALQIAVAKVKSFFKTTDTIDVSVGDVVFQFYKVQKSNEVTNTILVNSAITPLPEIELTAQDYTDILDIEAKNKLKIFWESNGMHFYAPPNQPVQILNPVVITTTKDYNMAKYRLRKADELLIDVLEGGATNVALLLGKPGTGKTFFTDCFSRRTGAEYMYALCHDGTNAEDLFYSVNVGKAVLREGTSSEDIYQAGLLLRAVRASHKHKVVLCIDEIDKASKRTENLFLDFAETYRVPFLGTQEVGVKENIVIFFTSNGYRPHSEAFLRRCYRHHFDFLPRDVEISLIGGTYAEKIVDALAAIRKDGASSPSIKEGMLFAHNLQYAKTKSDIELLFFAHLCKEEEDFEVLKKGNFADKFVKLQYAKVKF